MLLLFEKMVWSIAYNLQPLRDCVTSPCVTQPRDQPHVTFFQGQRVWGVRLMTSSKNWLGNRALARRLGNRTPQTAAPYYLSYFTCVLFCPFLSCLATTVRTLSG